MALLRPRPSFLPLSTGVPHPDALAITRAKRRIGSGSSKPSRTRAVRFAFGTPSMEKPTLRRPTVPNGRPPIRDNPVLLSRPILGDADLWGSGLRGHEK